MLRMLTLVRATTAMLLLLLRWALLLRRLRRGRHADCAEQRRGG